MIRIRRFEAPTRWLRRPRWRVQELNAEGEIRSDEVTPHLSTFLIERHGVHTTDYWDWVRAVEAATPAELVEIVAAVDRSADVLGEWLVGPEADASPTREYVALTCLTMAYDEARHR